MTESTSIIAQVATSPVIVLTDPKKAEALFTEIEQEIAGFSYDLSTGIGRSAVASLAHKIARTKTAIDAAGLALTEDWRKRTLSVNAERSMFKTKLDALRDKARAPLDAWEAAEEQRQNVVKAIIARINRDGMVTVEDTSKTVAERAAALKAVDITETVFLDEFQNASDARDRAVTALGSGYRRLVQEEADRAELSRLRAAEAERDRAAAAERDAAAAEARRVQEAAEAEAATQRRITEAAEQARREAEEAAAAEVRKRDAAEAARLAEAARIAEADRVRAADANHRQEVQAEVEVALVRFGVAQSKAVKIVLAIAAGEVPHVAIKY